MCITCEIDIMRETMKEQMGYSQIKIDGIKDIPKEHSRNTGMLMCLMTTLYQKKFFQAAHDLDLENAKINFEKAKEKMLEMLNLAMENKVSLGYTTIGEVKDFEKEDFKLKSGNEGAVITLGDEMTEFHNGGEHIIEFLETALKIPDEKIVIDLVQCPTQLEELLKPDTDEN